VDHPRVAGIFPTAVLPGRDLSFGMSGNGFRIQPRFIIPCGGDFRSNGQGLWTAIFKKSSHAGSRKTASNASMASATLPLCESSVRLVHQLPPSASRSTPTTGTFMADTRTLSFSSSPRIRIQAPPGVLLPSDKVPHLLADWGPPAGIRLCCTSLSPTPGASEGASVGLDHERGPSSPRKRPAHRGMNNRS
jgi:hypothetical protein